MPTQSPTTARAHPRMRGEHFPQSLELIHSPGSSPHARGAQRAAVLDVWLDGLIPACAGST
ncbi:Domain of uncharacterised function (DUF2825) [Nocardia farcinica]|uniref:Domain of uncharacterized function (DUF2825) n=1 Tax=Nocardia farcinica TaxID=37329 RepID=A0A449GHS9_NOCFR|nr:Domain of uncharacterised function (DUF2825) [Nocardia farcinica]